MPVTVTIEISRKFIVNAPLAKVFAVLADVPESASHFPRVESLTPLGGNAYEWKMRKNGFDKHAIQIVYASTYRVDKKAHRVEWSPVKGVGNSQVQGFWELSSADGSTECRFHTQGVLELPLPGLLKMAVGPVVKHEFNALVDQYVENLQNALAD